MLDQGTAHRDASGGNGFEGAARDPLQHALPLLHTAPGKVASVIRFTLSETYSAAPRHTDDGQGRGRGRDQRAWTPAGAHRHAHGYAHGGCVQLVGEEHAV